MMMTIEKERPTGAEWAEGRAFASEQTSVPNSVPNPENFPEVMRQKVRWIGWKWGTKGEDGRWIYFDRSELEVHDGHLWHVDADGALTRAEKLPICIMTGRAASVSNSRTWCSFNFALEALQAGKVDGMGYVLDKGEALIDIDGCINQNGKPKKFASNLIEKLDTYAELSVSGQGVHILCPSGDFEPTRGCKAARCEVYVGGHTNRYCTVSGDVLEGHGDLADDEENAADNFADFYHKEFARYPLKHTGGKGMIVFPEEPSADDRVSDEEAAALLVGHWYSGVLLFERGDLKEWRRIRSEHVPGSDNSQSEADFALAKMLLASTFGNPQQTVRLMRKSALWRNKYDEIHDGTNPYVVMTVRNALETCNPLAILQSADRRSNEVLKDYPDEFKPLVDLMKQDHVTHYMLRRVMCTRGKGAARMRWSTPIAQYPLDLILSHWGEIVRIAYQYNWKRVNGGAPRG